MNKQNQSFGVETKKITITSVLLILVIFFTSLFLIKELWDGIFNMISNRAISTSTTNVINHKKQRGTRVRSAIKRSATSSLDTKRNSL